MNNCFETEKFRFEYLESHTESSVLWESHCHSDFEMIAVMEGDISIMLEGKNYRLTEKQVAIIFPLSYHTVTSNKQGVYKRVTAQFGQKAIPDVVLPYFSKDTMGALVMFPYKGEKLKNICTGREKTAFSPLADALMIELLYDALQVKQNSAEIETDEFVHGCVMYIDSHLEEKITLDDIAKEMMRSKSSFCHLFEKKMKISPKQYILQKKLAYADMLINKGVPVSEVSCKIGYDNYSDFYRMYRKYFGKSPTKRHS